MAVPKVCIIGPGPKYLSGVSYYTWKLTSTLTATPLLFRDMLPRVLFPGKSRVGKVDTKIDYGPHGSLDWWNPWTWMKAVKICNQHDVVVIEWWSASVAHMYAFILAFCRQRIVVEAHETLDPMESKIWPIAIYARVMRKYIWGKADKIVVHARSDALTILAMYPKEEKYQKVVVIPLGVLDIYRDMDIKLANDTFCVLFYGLVREYKGVKYLIDGFLRANLPNSCMFIQGEHWDKIYEPQVRNIHFLKHYADDEWTEIMFSYADVVVLPYLRASQSAVAHIAMQYGLPIIATKVGGLADLSDYGGMRYISTADSYAIADALRHVYYNTRNKRFPVPKRLEWPEIKKQWMDLFNKMEVGS